MNSRARLEFKGTQLNSDGGLLVVRELDDAPGLSDLASAALPANNVLREKIAHRLTRPVGRSSLTKVKRFLEDFEDQAASWDSERRVIAKIDRHSGELFPRVGFIVNTAFPFIHEVYPAAVK